LRTAAPDRRPHTAPDLLRVAYPRSREHDEEPLPAGSALKLRRRAQLTRALRRPRNRPGGYWVAAADPQAASQAITGSLPTKTLHRAVLPSDDATAVYLVIDGST
jgi:hypothetical protein